MYSTTSQVKSQKQAPQLLRLTEQTKEEILWQHKEVNGILRIAASYTVRELRCDVGLIEGTVKAGELIVQPFKKDKLLLVASNKHPLSKKLTVKKEELLYTHWVMREKGSGTREYTDYLLQSIGNVKPSKTIISTNEGIKQSVLTGLGITAVSIHTVKDELRHGQIVKLNTDIKPFPRTFAILCTPIMAEKRNVQVFLQELNAK